MSRRTLNQALIVALTLLCSFWLYACSSGGGGGGGGGGGSAANTVSVSGQVTGSAGIAGATVSAGGVSDTTDSNGFYQLTAVTVPASGRLVITYDKDGYATYQRSLPVEAGKTYSAAAKLAMYDVTEPAVDQTNPPSIQGRDAGNNVRVQLDLQPDSLQGAAAGNVSVSVAIGDPSTEEGRATFPGDYMAAPASGAEPDTALESVAFSEITITDSAGTEITQLTQPADLKLRLPDEFQTGGAKAGTYDPTDPDKDSIEWWSYDETTGAWIREDADADDTNGVTDAAVVDEGGVLFAVAKVTHFTWWNADRPVLSHSCVCVNVVDDEMMAMSGVEVVAEGVSYNGTSYPALTDPSGNACVTVKKSEDGQTPETIKVMARAGTVNFSYDVTDASEGDVATNVIDTPTIQGSTQDNSGMCVDLMNDIAIAYNGEVQGTVTYEDSGQPVPDLTVYTSFGPTAVTDASGQYAVNVPLNVEVLLFVPGLASQAVTVTAGTSPATVDFLLPNRAPVITSLDRDPATTPLPSGTATVFTPVASDPDGDPITYAWTADSGSPTSGTGNTFRWTAPAGTGTALISLTVSDDKGSTDTEARSVAYGGSTGGTDLKVTVYDNPKDDSPVSGVYVILHGSDGSSVEQTLQTNAQGVADFGSIGRARATVTVAAERLIDYGGGETWTERVIDTFVDVPVGDVAYYQDDLEDVEHQMMDCSTFINVTASGAPAEADQAKLAPVWGWAGNPVAGTFTFPNVAACQGEQTDGTTSLLAGAQTGFDANGLVAYGYLLDQTIIDGTDYAITFDRIPVTLNWSTSPVTPLTWFSVSGTRTGAVFSELGSAYMDPPAGFGTLPFPNEFPVDFYWASGVLDDWVNGEHLFVMKRYPTISTSLELSVPDLAFDSADYTAATETFSWAISGTTAYDAISVEVAGTNTGGMWVSWEAILAPGTTSWTPVALPTPVSSWVDGLEDNAEEAYVGLIGLDIVTGLDELWNLFAGGVANPESTANESFFVEKDFSIGGAAQPVRTAGRAAASTTTEEQPPTAGVRKKLGALGRMVRF